MVAIKSLLFLATAVTALTIGKRDTATILNDISVINSDVQALTTAANNYNGGVLAAIPILTAQNNLESAIDQGTTDAQATAQQTSAESQSVIAAVDNLIPNSESPPTNSPTSIVFWSCTSQTLPDPFWILPQECLKNNADPKFVNSRGFPRSNSG